jgi:serine/threonine protein kinase
MVCPKCRRIYTHGETTCTVDGTRLVPEVGDFPTGYDESHYEDTHARGRKERSDAARWSGATNETASGATLPPPTSQPTTPSRPASEGSQPRSLTDSAPQPPGREGSQPRSLTDSSRTPVGRELSTPRVVTQDLQIAPGDLIADYQITGRLGEGGMGTVYAGVQPVIGKQVAIKVLLREFASNAEVVNRFIQEARAANQARSRYIVDIFSFGELNDGRHYFVMEYLDGKSLREVLSEKKLLTFDEGNGILRGMAKGLLAAHEKGIIHRDIKPENIMVFEEEDGTLSAKILDFGIAKLQGTMANPDFATKTGAAMGTPFYMSPEQCRGVDVDHRTDIYALGIIMFEMFAGQLPFKANSYIELVNKHLFASPPELRSLNPEASAQLEAFIMRCIAKNPDERPQTMKQFLSELSELVPSLHRTHQSAVRLTPISDTPYTPTDAGSPPSGAPKPRGRLGLVLALLAVVVLGGGGLGAYLVIAKGKQPTDAKTDAKTGGAPTPAKRVDARAARALVKVSTEPPGATVFLDGEQQERATPLEVERAPGKVALKVALPGFSVIEARLDLKPGPNAFSYRFERAPPDKPGSTTGSLVVRTNVRQATFFLDDAIVHQGSTLKLDRVAAKAHELKIAARGKQTVVQSITIRPNTKLELELKLKKRRRRNGKRPVPKQGAKQGTTSNDPDDTLNPFKKKK